jgi:hypothetical protein
MTRRAATAARSAWPTPPGPPGTSRRRAGLRSRRRRPGPSARTPAPRPRPRPWCCRRPPPPRRLSVGDGGSDDTRPPTSSATAAERPRSILLRNAITRCSPARQAHVTCLDSASPWRPDCELEPNWNFCPRSATGKRHREAPLQQGFSESGRQDLKPAAARPPAGNAHTAVSPHASPASPASPPKCEREASDAWVGTSPVLPLAAIETGGRTDRRGVHSQGELLPRVSRFRDTVMERFSPAAPMLLAARQGAQRPRCACRPRSRSAQQTMRERPNSNLGVSFGRPSARTPRPCARG